MNAVRFMSPCRWVQRLWLGLGAMLGCLSVAAVEPVSVVDLLALHTPAVMAQAGSSNAVYEQVHGAVINANLAFQNSAAGVRIRLAGVLPVAYEESGLLADDLRLLRTAQDGLAGEARSLRDNSRADLAVLVVAHGDPAYAGAPGPSAANALSVIRWEALADLAAAVSRNFGCLPERASASGQPAMPFAYGLVAGDGSWGTIESRAGGRLPAFSNPRLQNGGVPMGVPAGSFGAADNTRALSLIAPIVAAFRGAAPRTLPPTVTLGFPAEGGPVEGPKVLLRAEAQDLDGQVAQVEFLVNGLSVGVVTNTPFELEWQAPTEGSFTLRAVATDDSGATAVSEVMVFEVYFSSFLSCINVLTGGVVTDFPDFPLGGSDSGYPEVPPYFGSPCPASAEGCRPPDGITNPPPNDDFEQRLPVSGVSNVVSGFSVNATAEPGEPDHVGSPANSSVWFTWTAPANGRARFWVQSCQSVWRLAVYTGEAVTNLAPVAAKAMWSSTTEYCLTDYLEFQVRADVAYAIALDAADVAGLDYTLRFFFVPAPANDDFAERTLLIEPGYSLQSVAVDGQLEPELVGGTEVITGSNCAATQEPGEPDHLANPDGASVWWSWTAPRQGRLHLDPSGSEFAPFLAVYTGNALASLCVVATNSGGIDFAVQPGVTYALALDGVGGARGNYTLALSFFPSPLNDAFTNALARTRSGWTLQGNTHAATLEVGEPIHGTLDNSGSVWWRWTAPASGDVEINVAAARALDVGAYIGSQYGRILTLTNGPGPIGFYALRGVTYSIAAAGPAELDNPFTGACTGQPAPPTVTLLPSEGETIRHVRLTGLAGQSFVVQVLEGAPDWRPVLIDTLQEATLDLVINHRVYRVISLEDYLLAQPLKIGRIMPQPDQSIQVEVTGNPGQPFVLQASEDLASWSDLAYGAVVGEGSNVLDASTPARPKRFYRVKSLE